MLFDQVIEKKLGDKGMVCLEDLINEIHSVGPAFKVRVQTIKSVHVCARVFGVEIKVRV
jgi:hypothetical protein